MAELIGPDDSVPREAVMVDTNSDPNHESILVPIGSPSDDRLQSLAFTAAEAAGMMETRVHILHVFTNSRYERVVEQLGYDHDEYPLPDQVATRVKAVRTLAQELTPHLHGWGMQMRIEGRIGDTVSEEIVAAAEESHAKRIFLGVRGRTATGKAVFGSTAQDVLCDAPCPVTLVRDV